MRVKVETTIEVDAEAWAREFGVPGDDASAIRDDVKVYFEAAVHGQLERLRARGVGMIHVLLSNGDNADAADEAAAVVAARVMLDDARDAGTSGLTASFYTLGRLVRSGVTRTELV